MLKAPQRYLETIISNAGTEKNLSLITLHLISRSGDNLHFIIDEKELNLVDIICKISRNKKTSTNTDFVFQEGQKVINFNSSQTGVFSILSLNPIKLKSDVKEHTKFPKTLNDFIPLTNSPIHQVGTIKKRIDEFKEFYCAENKNNFFSNEKLLVIGNLNLFHSISHSYPACFSFENENGDIEIKYNSLLLPKISILKNINLLDRYLEKEINGEHVTFNTCIFIGSSKFEHSITTIRNYYNQKRFLRAIFIGEKDIKINLGNDQIPLRWKWTIPEIKYFNNEQVIEPKIQTIQNIELKEAISQFYLTIRDIETRHTISLKSLFRFVRRLYYDWTLKTETNQAKLNQIKDEFKLALKELLEETFFSINPDFNFEEYRKTISLKHAEIISAIKTNNKTERIKTYQNKIHQFVTPSFLCSNHKSELNQIFKKSQKHAPSANSLESLGNLDARRKQYWNDTTRNYFSLTADQSKADIVSFAKSDNVNVQCHKVVSSIYGNGKIERVIERLGKANTPYNLLLYGIEEKAFRFHIDRYVEELNREYASNDRYQICGIAFNDNYYQFSTFDTLIEALTSTQQEKDIDEYKIIFTDNSTVKLPLTKSVLKISDTEKTVVRVEDLDIGDKVQVYENPDKATLRTIFELKHPDLVYKADKYSTLWQQCLLDYLNKVIFEGQVYDQLRSNGFSVSINTMQRYLRKEVMFPRRKVDLIAIAKTVNNNRLSFDFVRNTMLPFIHDYNGKMIEYGFKLSDSINHFLITGEMDEFISEWYPKKEEVEKIVTQIPIKTIKDIELLTIKSEPDE